MATDQPVTAPALPSEIPNPPADDGPPWSLSALRRLAGTLAAAAVDEARNTAASVLVGGIVWWLTHR